MKSQTLDVAYVAGLARIELTKEEETLFQTQLGNILDYVQQLQQIDISSVPDTPVDPNLPTNVLRPDEVRPSLTVSEALQNAPKKANNLVVMPKIVE